MSAFGKYQTLAQYRSLLFSKSGFAEAVSEDLAVSTRGHHMEAKQKAPPSDSLLLAFWSRCSFTAAALNESFLPLNILADL
jgi:hypothetical protein